MRKVSAFPPSTFFSIILPRVHHLLRYLLLLQFSRKEVQLYTIEISIIHCTFNILIIKKDSERNLWINNNTLCTLNFPLSKGMQTNCNEILLSETWITQIETVTESGVQNILLISKIDTFINTCFTECLWYILPCTNFAVWNSNM